MLVVSLKLLKCHNLTFMFSITKDRKKLTFKIPYFSVKAFVLFHLSNVTRLSFIFHGRYTYACDGGHAAVLNRLLHLGSYFHMVESSANRVRCTGRCECVWYFHGQRRTAHLRRSWKLDGIRTNTLAVGVLGAGICPD